MDAVANNEMTVTPFSGSVTVRFGDAIIASTTRAKLLSEAGHEPVYYIPFEDISFEFLKRSDTSTKCPRKGTATYWDAFASGQGETDVMWAYETPIPRAAGIAAHGAFYPNKARIETDAQ